MKNFTRRNFIKNSAVVSAGLSILPTGTLFAKSEKTVRLGFIGVGLRGQNHLNNALNRDDVDVVSICDISDRMLGMSKDIIKKSGKKMPKIYTGDDYAWRKLIEQDDIDGVIIATPWEWHSIMCIESMEAGKYVGTEVVMGTTLKEHWDVVDACERTGKPLMMLENVCYRRDVMAALNMARQGVFGELIHLQGGYQHDLRAVKFNDGEQAYGGGVLFGDEAFSEAKWRTNHSVHRNGDLYPTHGVGPVMNYVNINHGNRFTSLSSFSTKSRGLHNYIVDNGGDNHPNAKIKFKLGDVVTTQLNTVNGETVILQLDTNLPRPYSLGFRVQGTKGLWMDVNNGMHIEGISKAHHWDDAREDWFKKYDHPLWKRWTAETEGAGHGGMDFFVLHAFVESIKRNTNTPIDVYDSATMSAITPLSEESIALGNETVEFPDFTKGKWLHQKPIFALTDEY